MKKSELHKLIKEAIKEVRQENLNENPAAAGAAARALASLARVAGTSAARSAGAALGKKAVDKFFDDEQVEEGKLGKFLGGAALLAALLMGNAKLNDKIYDQSPKLKVLVQKLEKAKADGNEELIDKIEDQIKFQKIRIDVNR